MGETKKPVITYAEDVTGRPRAVTEESSLEKILGAQGNLLSEGEALSRNQEQLDQEAVEGQYGPLGGAAMGVAGGLGLGLSMPLAAGITGLIDPDRGALAKRDLRVLGDYGPYQAGEYAGLLLPSLFSGGAAGSASTIGRVFGSTPAGLLGELGTTAERLALRSLPETTSALGRVGRGALSMAARGATEGALIDVSNTIGKSIVQDHALTAQTVLASGLEGALMGGLLGGGLGAAGRGLGEVGEAGMSLGGRTKEQAIGTVLKQLGGKAGDAAKLGNSTEEIQQALQGFHRNVMEPSGLTLRSSASEINQAASKAVSSSKTIQRGIVEELQKGAPSLVPDMGRVSERLANEAVAPYLGTFSQQEVQRAVGKVQDGLVNLGEKGGTKGFGTWESWMDARNKVKSVLNSFSDQALAKDLQQRVLTVLDSELNSGLEAAAKSLSKPSLAPQYQAAVALERYSEALAEITGSKGTGTKPLLDDRDLKTLGWGALYGGPVGVAKGAGVIAGRKVLGAVRDAVEPFMAQKAYETLVGASAAASVANTRSHIKKAVQGFFQASSKATTRASVKSSRKDGLSSSRAGFEKTLERTAQLTSPMHQEKVRQMAEALTAAQQQRLASEMILTNARATQYLQNNMPQSKKTKDATGLMRHPDIHGLSNKEWEFLRKDKAVKHPLSILDKLESGDLTTAEVRAVKYVYPELHKEIVSGISERVLEMKQRGEFLPVEKVAQLGIVLDSPVDTFLEPQFVNTLQAALAQPSPDQATGSAHGVNNGAIGTQNLMTPMEKSLLA